MRAGAGGPCEARAGRGRSSHERASACQGRGPHRTAPPAPTSTLGHLHKQTGGVQRAALSAVHGIPRGTQLAQKADHRPMRTRHPENDGGTVGVGSGLEEEVEHLARVGGAVQVKIARHPARCASPTPLASHCLPQGSAPTRATAFTARPPPPCSSWAPQASVWAWHPRVVMPARCAPHAQLPPSSSVGKWHPHTASGDRRLARRAPGWWRWARGRPWCQRGAPAAC